MRRADRLFRIVQYLRSRRLTTAQWLAGRLEVSTRTVYRDIADLSASGVPVSGEAGVGYALRAKLDLPPLLFERNELAAIELGLRFVGAHTAKPLARAAESAMSKVRAASPGPARPVPLFAPGRPEASRISDRLLAAVDGGRKIRIRYRDERGAGSERVVWPLGLFFWGADWTILAWCELRRDFRSFRTGRIRRLEALQERYPDVPGKRLADYFRWMEKTHAVPTADFDPHH